MSSPDTSMPAPDVSSAMPAPDPTAGLSPAQDPSIPAPDVSGAMPQPDMTAGLSPAPTPTAPQLAPQPAQKPSLWRAVLSGALQGLAAAPSGRGLSGGAAFAAGLGAGANQVLNVQPQQQAALAQQQAALQKDKLEVAGHYIALQQAERQFSQQPQSQQDAHLSQAAADSQEMLKAGAAVPVSDASDFNSTKQTLMSLHAKNPWAVYSIAPVRSLQDGSMQFRAVQFPKAPLQSDLMLKGAGEDGSDLTIPAGTPADKVGTFYTQMLGKKIDATSKQSLSDSKAADAQNLQGIKGQQQTALQNSRNAASIQRATIAASGQNVVAVDPTYQNPDGTTGANVVMDKATAQQRGLFNYKADPTTINSIVGGFNDVQTKLNQLASIVNDTNRMKQVQPELAAAMLEHGKGISLDVAGANIDTSRINEGLYKEDVNAANQSTRDFVNAYLGAHESVTQLPRLQTFGKSSRMTETQLHAALNLLPQPGDGPSFAQDKMHSLQTMIDPLRRQVPKMPGAELIPSWLEQKQKPPAATHVFDPLNGVLQILNNNGGAQ